MECKTSGPWEKWRAYYGLHRVRGAGVLAAAAHALADVDAERPILCRLGIHQWGKPIGLHGVVRCQRCGERRDG